MAVSIGIKIANGEFYPILEEGTSVKKRLILTTVHDGQESVQIDLYKSESISMSDAEYIGSLVIEHIAPKPKGEPSIEMTITSHDSEELIAEAVDLDVPNDSERHQLTVSLKALEQSDTYDLPDFELDTSVEHPPAGLYERASAIREQEDQKEQKKPFPLIPVLLGLAIVILIALLVYLFVFNGSKSQKTEQNSSVQPTTSSAVQEPVKEPETTTTAAAAEEPKPEVVVEVSPPKPAAETKPARTRPPAPVSTYKVPLTIPKEGVPYKIRWGDTLWDISEAFYRNPWLYPRIARFNKIRNPDLIISGTTIRIPPKP